MFHRKPSIPRTVQQSELGAMLPKSELREIGQLGTLIDIDEGEEIIAESTSGRECFVIVDGKFEVSGTNVKGAVGPGDIAGELALLTGRTRNASVVAGTDGAVYALHPQEFATLLSQAPQFRAHVLTAAKERLGTSDVTLPAQFVRRVSAPGPGFPSWAERLGEVPGWGPSG